MSLVSIATPIEIFSNTFFVFNLDGTKTKKNLQKLCKTKNQKNVSCQKDSCLKKRIFCIFSENEIQELIIIINSQ